MHLTACHAMYLRQMHGVLRPTTLREHKTVIRGLVDKIGDMEIRAVRVTHLQDWIAGQQVQASTIRHRISVVRSFFRWAQEHQIIRHDPMVGIRAPRQPRAVPRAIPEQDVNELIRGLRDNRARLVIGLMLHLGLRVGEVSRLEMADFDFVNETVRIIGKGGHERILPLVAPLRPFLADYLAERGRQSGPVIMSKKQAGKGINANTLSHLVSEWMDYCGIKGSAYDGRSAHALRHTMCETLYAAGTDLRTIAAAAGHASPTTTWKYLRHNTSVDELRAVMGTWGSDARLPAGEQVEGRRVAGQV